MTAEVRGTVVMDGVALRDETVRRLRAEIAELGDPSVCIATVLVGDDRPSEIYVRSKHRHAELAGMRARHAGLPGSATQAEVEAAVLRFAEDPDVHGILVQLPLPAGIDTEAILDLVPVEKDIDGLTEASMGRLLRGRAGHVPCTPKGVLRLLDRYGIATAGAHAVVIGRSSLVGLPLAVLLARKGADATVTLAHSRTGDLVAHCREADIVVSAAGVAGLITGDHIRPGATVVDVGVSRTAAGIVGDVDLASIDGIAGAVTPMPGGTGPMTIACLLENTLDAARVQGAVGR